MVFQDRAYFQRPTRSRAQINELTIGFPISGIPGNGNALGTMDEEEIAENVRLAELWCQIERDHNLHEAFGMASFGYWAGPKKATKSCRRV